MSRAGGEGIERRRQEDEPGSLPFESPTPAGLVALIEAARPAEGPSDADKLAELLAQLDDLSPEEVERMLAERGE